MTSTIADVKTWVATTPQQAREGVLALSALPENQICADCHTPNPKWASPKLGVFVCLRCAGVHRSIGVHVSRILSISLDSWTPQQFSMMQRVGNLNGALVWESGLPEGFVRPDADKWNALSEFVRNKYERGVYFNRAAAASFGISLYSDDTTAIP
eukprot:TRINITY_DN1215_c0_g1_i1.p1 TRINITY_DN1215_c0_g1~~TRINITY_DN1215_c0_g1_i1.p1  ORF type:complete len:155 (+),score=16.04 TRINITY_DN1215_c0_g1_i1:130-594(+)